MTKQAPRTRPWALAAAALCASAVAACGGASTVAAGSGTQATGLAYGTVPLGTALLTVADASSPSKQLQATTSAAGTFTVDTSGLTAPYLLKVVSGGQALYAVAEDAANLDVNPITDAAFSYAAGDAGSAALFQAAGAAQNAEAATQARALLTDLAAQATPLLARYGIANLRTDRAAVRLLLHDVAVTRANGVVTLTNRNSGSVIQTMPMGGPQNGAFDPCQLPPGSSGGSSSGGSSSGGSSSGGSSSGGSSSGGSSSGGSSSCTLPANHPSISSGTSCSTCHASNYSACTAIATTAAAPNGSGNTTNLPANHPTIPSGATCTSCHAGGPGRGSSSGGPPPAPPPSSSGASSSSSGGSPPAPPSSSGGSSSGGSSSSGSSSSGSSSSGSSSGGLPPAPPASSSGASSSSGGSITCPSSSGGTSSSGGASSGGTSSTDGATIYAAKCAICHGGLGSSNKQGATTAQILARHPNYVTSAEATAIASALSASTSSSGGTSSSSGGSSPATGSACGYGSNTAALAVTSGSQSLDAGSYTAAGQNESGVCVTNAGSTLTLANPTIATTGNTSSTDNSSFYGQNAGALAYTGGTLAITGGTISTTGTGANGVFAYGTGKATVTGTTIEAKAEGGHGLMTAGGGTLVAKDVTATTWGQNGSVIATDRGTGNKVTVSGGTFVGHGYHSAGVYSTGEITVSNATLTSEAAEGVVIEGKNSVTLNDCTVTSSSSDKRGMFVYQSFSGDASVGQGVLTINGGSYTFHASDATSAAFYATNTTASITLDGVKVTNPTGYLLQAGANQWGTSGSNGAAVTFSARNETLRGDVVADAISSVAASFVSSSSYTGAVNAANTAKAISVALDATSLWTVTATSYVHTLAGVVLSGSTVTNIAGSAAANVCYRTSFTDSSGATHASGTYALKNGGSLLKC